MANREHSVDGCRDRNGFIWACVAAVATLVLSVPAPAGAEVSVGQVPFSTPLAACNSGPADVLETSVSSGSSYIVPPGYPTLTSWSTFAAAGAQQQMTLKVFRKIAEPSTYRVIAHDGPRTLTPGVLNTFAVSIPVQAGDAIGLNDANAQTINNACVIETLNPADVFIAKGKVDVPDGNSVAMEPPVPGFLLNIKATVDRLPTVTSLLPAQGTIAGGTSITISGQDLTSAKSVMFGASPTASFTVNSDSSITAVTPATGLPGPVAVSVTNAIGQNPAMSAATFTYTACVVPKLKGKKIARVRKQLRKRKCKLGKVRGEKGGRVVKQRPKAGSKLPVGSRVGVKLSKPSAKGSHPQ